MPEEINPYAAPEYIGFANAEPAAYDPTQVVSGWRRFGTWIIDYISYVILAALIGGALGALGLVDFLEGVPDLVVGIPIMMLYYLPMELFLGQTLGKLVLGTKVVSVDNKPLTLKRIFGRTCARFVPFEPFSCIGRQPVPWHDKWSNTRVVRSR